MEEQLRDLPGDMRTCLGPDSTLASAPHVMQPRPSLHLPPAQAYGSGSHSVIPALTTLPVPSLREHSHALFPGATTPASWLRLTCCLVLVPSEATMEKKLSMFSSLQATQ